MSTCSLAWATAAKSKLLAMCFPSSLRETAAESPAMLEICIDLPSTDTCRCPSGDIFSTALAPRLVMGVMLQSEKSRLAKDEAV
jgi:hypothetical protein